MLLRLDRRLKMPSNLHPSVLSNPPPKVSVAICTYNHEKFIAQAIEGVLMQETSFPIELVIGEDCSTDGTRAILRKYAQTHPNIVRPLLHKRNVGGGTNFTSVLATCRGEYIAFLDGDDYWTDTRKLEIQVRFLEEHPECAMCHHRVSYVDDESQRLVSEFPPEERRREQCSADLLAKGNFIQTCSLMTRKELIPDLTDDFMRLKLGDWPLCVLLGLHGSIGYIDKNMATYRIHVASNWSSKSVTYMVIACIEMARYLIPRIREPARSAWIDYQLGLQWRLAQAAENSAFNCARAFGEYWLSALRYKRPITMVMVWRGIRLMGSFCKRRIFAPLFAGPIG